MSGTLNPAQLPPGLLQLLMQQHGGGTGTGMMPGMTGMAAPTSGPTQAPSMPGSAPTGATGIGALGDAMGGGLVNLGNAGKYGMMAASMAPGPIGMLAGLASTGMRGYNTAQADATAQSLGLPGLSLGQTIGGITGLNGYGNLNGTGNLAAVNAQGYQNDDHGALAGTGYLGRLNAAGPIGGAGAGDGRGADAGTATSSGPGVQGGAGFSPGAASGADGPGGVGGDGMGGASDGGNGGFAHGGTITGASLIGRAPAPDKGYVPAKPGEFIVNAAMAKQYAPILHAINAGTYAPPPPVATPMAAPQGQAPLAGMLAALRAAPGAPAQQGAALPPWMQAMLAPPPQAAPRV